MNWPANFYQHRHIFTVNAEFVVYADHRMGLPSYSEWLIPGTWED